MKKVFIFCVIVMLLFLSFTVSAAECTAPIIAVGSDTACNQEEEVSIPVTISGTGGRNDCSFSFSFDRTKLQYTGATAGDMVAALMTANHADINAAGKVQPIVSFVEGGAAFGTFAVFRFALLTPLAPGSEIALTVGDIIPAGSFCGESGRVTCPSAGADLTGHFSGLASTCIRTRCRITGTFVLQNQGTRNAPASSIYFYLSGDTQVDGSDLVLKQVSAAALNAGQSRSFKLIMKLTGNPKGKYVIAVTDATGAVNETNEGNNMIIYGPFP